MATECKLLIDSIKTRATSSNRRIKALIAAK